jgi:hypothetical protein
MGFHDKVNVKESEFNIDSFIKQYAYPLEENLLKRNGKEIHREKILKYLIHKIKSNIDSKYELPSFEWDQVCVRCGECFCDVDFMKEYIKDKITKYYADILDKEVRAKIASDLWKEKCKS